jgi:hypothetical protein
MKYKVILQLKFKQSEFNQIPDSLQILFNKIKVKNYQELYQPDADSNGSLQDDLKIVLDVLDDGNNLISHLRYAWMTLILILSVKPTLKYYDSKNSLPEMIIELIKKFLYETPQNESQGKKINPDHLDEIINELFKDHQEQKSSYFHKQGVNTQVIRDALDVFSNAMKVMNYDLAGKAVLEILSDCLEGYAIFPGSSDRRGLFDWWLLDVVPASYNLLPPKSFYLVEGLENKQKIKLRQTFLLNKISKHIRRFLIQESMVKFRIVYRQYSFLSNIKINHISEYNR